MFTKPRKDLFLFGVLLKITNFKEKNISDTIKIAKNPEEAFNMFKEHNLFDGFIQWKGTDVCMDFYCECGYHNHYDGYFCYAVKCKNCGNMYAPSSKVEMIRVLEADSPLESNQ